jgi:predicted SnoaL-like aldol condensation-catalyzing enzyme
MDDVAERDRLENNKKLAQRFMDLVVNPETAAQARNMMTDEYVQHNPNLPDGPDAILNFAAMDEGKEAKAFMKIAGPAKFIAEGDHVIMIQPLSRPDPLHPGEEYTLWWFDMWRIENGKLAEHWDADEKRMWSLRG